MNRSPRFPRLFTDIIVTGKYTGRKVVALQTLTGDAGLSEGDTGKIGGLSLHPGVAAEEHKSLKMTDMPLWSGSTWHPRREIRAWQ